jgi:TolB-like protein/DNA-binding winged helix-turn-helix (wHTH) protein
MASEHPKAESEPFALGAFRVDPSRRIIDGPDGETTIEPKIMAVLRMLAAHPGEVVTRQQFIETIWATEYGGDESLTRAVSQLRKILGDAPGNHRYIETVPKTGYRLVVPQDSQAPEGVERGRRGLLILVAVGLLMVLAAAVYDRMQLVDSPQPQAADGKASIMLAVLPFDIQGGTSEDEPLAFGVADEILSVLSRNPSIAVIAGNSSFQFRGDNKSDLAALGKKLNVSHVVDGSLRRSPEGLRVGVYLIDAGTGVVEWSDVVTRPEDEIYTIPGEVAASVQTALGAEPVVDRSRRAAPDPAAYESYLYAKSLLHKPWGENVETAIEELERAVTLDPDMSEAWSILAITLVELGFSEGPAQPEPGATIWSQRLQAARLDAETALAIDPQSVEARLALVLINQREQTVPLTGTVEQLRSLVAGAPYHSKLNYRMGMLMASVGRFEEAIGYLGRARALDPLTFLNTALYADALLCSGRVEQVLALVRSMGAYEIYKRKYTGLITNLLAGDFQAAREGFTDLGANDVFIVDGVMELPSIKVDSLITQRMSELMARLIDVAERADVSSDPSLAADLIEAADHGLIPHFYVAQLLAVSGFRDAALDLVAQRIDEGDWLVRDSGILLRPAFSKARHDPGIMQWLDRTGHVDYWLGTGNWPDYCSDPNLPYDCEEAASRFKQATTAQTSAAPAL